MDVQTSLRELEAAGWAEITDRLVQGLCHGLNGHLSTLIGLLYMGRKREPGDAGWMGHLEGELDRVEAVVRLMEGIAWDGVATAEVLDLSELLDEVVKLQGRVRGLDKLEMELLSDGAPAVRINRTVAKRALLLLLSWTAHHVREAGGARVVCTLAPDAGGATIVFRSPSSADAPPAESTPGPNAGAMRFRDHMLERVAGVLEGAGGRLTTSLGEPGNVSVEIGLPAAGGGESCGGKS